MAPQHIQSKKPDSLTNVAIIGCGNGGKALMEIELLLMQLLLQQSRA